MAFPVIPLLGPVLGKVLDSIFPDPAQKAEIESKLMLGLMAHEQEVQKAVGAIIQTEAASEHWLAANWRPLAMLTFVTLIVARWFGWAAPSLSEAEYLKLWDIVELGLGGYVMGRSLEKVVPSLGNILKK